MASSIEYACDSDIDFFSQLKQMKNAPVSASASASATATASASAPRCLITDEPLRKDHITLQCGHKFNYVPLFKEVLFQKCSLLPKNLSASIITMYTNNTTSTPSSNVVSVTYNSSYNLETRKLQYNEIKCPYCRTITSKILPYYPYPEVCKIKYVNAPPNLAMPGLSCEYHEHGAKAKPKAKVKAKAKTITDDGNNGNAGNDGDESKTCKSGCVYNETYDMMLCNKHLNKKDTDQKTKPSISTAENIIVSHHNPATSLSSSCSFLLLSGARKGLPCGKPIWTPKTPTPTPTHNTHCKAHFHKQ